MNGESKALYLRCHPIVIYVMRCDTVRKRVNFFLSFFSPKMQNHKQKQDLEQQATFLNSHFKYTNQNATLNHTNMYYNNIETKSKTKNKYNFKRNQKEIYTLENRQCKIQLNVTISYSYK